MKENAVVSRDALEEKVATKNNEISINNENAEDIFNNVRYICNSTSLITEALQSGWDVAQLPNGDVIVTEVVTVNVLYSWDKNKQKMVKVSH